MTKVSYAGLKLKINNENETFNFNDSNIEVIKYLPIKDKIDLIAITLQKSMEDGFYNSAKIDMFFHLGLVYMYTNLSFTDKQKEDEYKLYDILESNGFIDELIKCIDEKEYEFLVEHINQSVENYMNYKTTAASVLNSIISDLPRNAEAAVSILNTLDLSKFKELEQFSKNIE